MHSLDSQLISNTNDTQDEYALQYALGRLVMSPALLRHIQHGERKIGDLGLTHQASHILRKMLKEQAWCLEFMARMLDERLLKNVLRFLPLTSVIAPPGFVSQRWQAFRDRDPDTEWTDPRRCALAFCEDAARDLMVPSTDTDMITNMCRYERAVLRVNDRLHRHWPTADEATHQALEQSIYPIVATTCEIEYFKQRISAIVQQLRTTGRTDAHPTDGSDTYQDETLLFYASWSDRQVHVLRVSPNTVALVGLCDGTTRFASLRTKLSVLHYPAAALARLHRDLEHLQRIGVIRMLANPVIGQIAIHKGD